MTADEATTDLTAVLAAWFTENLTFDRFREWSDEDFATRLADALAPVIRAERAAALHGAGTLLDLEAEDMYEDGNDLDAETYRAAARFVKARAEAERRCEPNG